MHFRSSQALRRLTVALASTAALLVLAPATGAAGTTAAAPATRAAGTTAAAAPIAASCPWVGSHQSIARRVAEVLAQMSISDEITVVEGHGSSNPYVFYMPGIPRLCIPQLGLEDGPAGVADQQTGVTQLASPVALAATWDPSLARQYGQVIGSEELGKGAAVNLGPTVNIDRDPRWGRSFEAFTEDPFLNASIGTSEIQGVQSTREMSQVKHYDAYNQETNRNTALDDVLVSARALHEIYMPAFEAAVKQAGVASVMCAYSTVNGNYSCENPYLETQVLRDEWDFPGFVTSDYAAIHDLSAAIAGTDMEQPFNNYFGAPLQNAVQGGTIPRSVLNTMVARILTEMFRFGVIDHPPAGTTSATVTTPGHVALSNEVAQDGATLLRDVRGTLPLSSANAHTVAVIGTAASSSPVYGGGGSAYVIPSGTITPLQGIEAGAGAATHVVYQPGLPTDTALPPIPSTDLTPTYSGTPFGGNYTGTLTAPETGTYVIAMTNACHCYTPSYLYVNGRELIDNPGTPPVDTYSAALHLTAGQKYAIKIISQSSNLDWGTPSALAPGIASAVAAAKSASRAVVVVSDDTESEATDRPSLNLPSAQDELIAAVAAVNPHTTVVINAGAPVVMPWLGQTGAVLDAWYPGQTSGTALADVLFGRVNPGGHLPVSFPASLSQVPAANPARFPGINGKVHYSEGLDVGYRWYDATGTRPLFPFGFGLSYTRFTFGHLHVVPRVVNGLQDVSVLATITNAGSRAGSDVAQLYLGDPPAAGEPPRQLIGFRRVELRPGQSAQLQFTITPRDTWWWDQQAGGWNQSTGIYRVYAGDSSALAGLPLRGSFQMVTSPGARQVVVHAPRRMRPGRMSTVKVRLTASGDATLHGVRLSLQVPQGFMVHAVGRTVFGRVGPATAPVATFVVEPPSWYPATNAVIHATASLSGFAQREGGVTATVG